MLSLGIDDYKLLRSVDLVFDPGAVRVGTASPCAWRRCPQATNRRISVLQCILPAGGVFPCGETMAKISLRLKAPATAEFMARNGSLFDELVNRPRVDLQQFCDFACG